MALSAKQIQCVAYELGWPSKVLDVGSTHYSKIFNDRITTISAEGCAKVVDILCRITNIREQIDEAQCRLSITQVDGLQMNEQEIRRLWKLHRRYVCELSGFLDLPVMSKNPNVSCVVV